jgi:hypothetical protein
MSAHFNVAREVQSKLDEALRKEAADLGVWKAVYFNVVIDFRDPTVVNPWQISPISDQLLCYGNFVSAMQKYLNSEIGAISTQVRNEGFVKRESSVQSDFYAIAIVGQQIGSDIFLAGICSENGPDADKLDQILAIHDVYSPTSDYLNLCKRYECLKEPPPD